MAVVRFPKPSKEEAYDPNRPLYKNQLILKQVEHFHHVDQRLPEKFQTHVQLDEIKTEGQAAAYIARVTKAIHETGGRLPARVRRAT
jgi:hypothetical protein